MIVLVIIGILTAVYFLRSGGVSSRPDGRGTTLPGAVMAEAKDLVCKNRLDQIRQAIQLARTTDDANPRSLEETRLGTSFYQCPLGSERYRYDPTVGKVECPHPGHVNL